MDIGIIITGCIGLLTTIASGWASYLFTRKKYHTEVDANEIDNLRKSLEFYEKIVKDNNDKLRLYIDMAEENRVEVYRLKGIIHRILNNTCIDDGCTKRKFYSESQIREILGEVKNKENETKSTEINK